PCHSSHLSFTHTAPAPIYTLSLHDALPISPQLPAGVRLDRHGVPVEQVIDDLSVYVEGAAIDGVATGDADGVRAHVRPIFPSQRISLPGEIECVQHVGPWRDDIHGVADHQRLALVPSEHARREGPHRME